MTLKFDAATKAIENTSNKGASERPQDSTISLPEKTFAHRASFAGNGSTFLRVSVQANGKPLKGRKPSEQRDGRIHADGLLSHANYNDEPDPAVKETVEKLVDTDRIVVLERINPDALPKKYAYRFIKRLFDIVSCSIALVICAIPMLIIAIMVKRDSPGPVFYRQQRLGYLARPITVVKFSSMRIDAEAMGAQWAQGEDPRVTKVGAFLRKTRLDELPQFWAVVKGDLSLIGPRPEREVFYREFEKYIHGFSQRMLARSGIAWDIIAPKPEAGKKVSGARILPAYEGSRTARAVAA